MQITHNDVMTAATLSIDVYHLPLDWLVHEEDCTVWVAIEGSDESVDWRRNLEFVFTADDVHAGFANYATLLMAQILSAGTSFDSRKRLILCGHSLGGAVATIIASHLQPSFPHLGLITFGSPRPGGRRFHICATSTGMTLSPTCHRTCWGLGTRSTHRRCRSLVTACLAVWQTTK